MTGLKAFLGKSRRAVVELSVFSIVVNLLMLVMPLYMLQVYDRVLTSASWDTLVFLSVIAGLALVLLGIVEAVRGIYAARLGSRLETAIGRGALLATLDGPRAGLGDVQTMRDMQQVRGFLSGRSVFALFDLPFAPLFIIFLWFVHPALFWLTTVGAVVLAIIAWANQRTTAKANKASMESATAANLAAQSLARSRESLVAMGMVENVVSTWGRNESRSLEALDRATRTNSWFTGLSRTLRMGLQVAVLGYGAALVLDGEMTAGMIFASSIISGRALQPIDQVIGNWRGFVEVGRAWKRLREAVAPYENERERTTLADPEGRLELDNVVYGVTLPGQAQGKAIIKRITGGIRPGETVGMIGPSGAGKSTLLRLMVGALRPNQGTVRLDGSDLRNWPADQRGRHFGYLAQDVELLPGTVRDNIARFDPEASAEEVRLAAERAAVTDLIQSLPMGYDTPIGPGGHELSGGERQRIGLARAFFRMPRVIVLDEPNAALDEAGDAALKRALAAAREAGSTVIIAAQRREILRDVDKVMVVEDGQVVRFDTVEAVGRWWQERASMQGGNVAQLSPRGREAASAPDGSGASRAPDGAASRAPDDATPAVGPAPTRPDRDPRPREAEATPVRTAPPRSDAAADGAAPLARGDGTSDGEGASRGKAASLGFGEAILSKLTRGRSALGRKGTTDRRAPERHEENRTDGVPRDARATGDGQGSEFGTDTSPDHDHDRAYRLNGASASTPAAGMHAEASSAARDGLAREADGPTPAAEPPIHQPAVHQPTVHQPAIHEPPVRQDAAAGTAAGATVSAPAATPGPSQPASTWSGIDIASFSLSAGGTVGREAAEAPAGSDGEARDAAHSDEPGATEAVPTPAPPASGPLRPTEAAPAIAIDDIASFSLGAVGTMARLAPAVRVAESAAGFATGPGPADAVREDGGEVPTKERSA